MKRLFLDSIAYFVCSVTEIVCAAIVLSDGRVKSAIVYLSVALVLSLMGLLSIRKNHKKQEEAINNFLWVNACEFCKNKGNNCHCVNNSSFEFKYKELSKKEKRKIILDRMRGKKCLMSY